MRESYLIYPSLLDEFAKFQRADRDFESSYNQDEDGNYIKTYDEIAAILELSLLSSINRVPFDSEPKDKGTVFNEIVDCIIHSRKSDKVELVSNKVDNIITASYKGRQFVFNYRFCIDAARYFQGATSKVYVSSQIETAYGLVGLYGYVDEIRQDVVYDIKTTSRYAFGKYSEGWQRHVYPYCLVQSGEMDVKAFEYTAYALKGGTSRTPAIYGVQYPELYVYNHAESTELIRAQCERFIDYLIANRGAITDLKIFNLHENEAA